MTCGTVEEKILRNQIFKRGLHRVVLQKEHQQRYFTRQQLHALFDLGPTDASQTHAELSELHGHQRRESAELESHRIDVERRGERWVRGISDYHLLFSHLAAPPLESDTVGLATPRAARTRPHRSGSSDPRPAPRGRARAAPSSHPAAKKAVLDNLGFQQASENQENDESTGLMNPGAIAAEEALAGFCSPSHLARLGEMGRRRLGKLLTAARAAEAELLRDGMECGQAGKRALRHYLRAAELLLNVLGESVVTAEHQSKLLRLAAAAGVSTFAARGRL